MELTGRCCTLRLSSLCYLSSITTAVAMQQLLLSSSLRLSITVWVSIMLYKIFWGEMKKRLLISKRAPISDIESNQIRYWANILELLARVQINRQQLSYQKVYRGSRDVKLLMRPSQSSTEPLGHSASQSFSFPRCCCCLGRILKKLVGFRYFLKGKFISQILFHLFLNFHSFPPGKDISFWRKLPHNTFYNIGQQAFIS